MSRRLQRVWLILVEVRILGENRVNLKVGSEALVQCFVPETILEVALREVDPLLSTAGLRRTDVLKCESFEEEIEEEDDVPDFIQRDVHEARASGKPVLGMFFAGEDSASFEGE